MAASLIFPWAQVSQDFYGVSLNGFGMAQLNGIGVTALLAAGGALTFAAPLASRPRGLSSPLMKLLAVAFVVGMLAASLLLIALIVARSQRNMVGVFTAFLGLGPGIGLFAYIASTIVGLLATRRLWRVARRRNDRIVPLSSVAPPIADAEALGSKFRAAPTSGGATPTKRVSQARLAVVGVAAVALVLTGVIVASGIASSAPTPTGLGDEVDLGGAVASDNIGPVSDTLAPNEGILGQPNPTQTDITTAPVPFVLASSVDDRANVLGPSGRSYVGDAIASLQTATGLRLHVATIPTYPRSDAAAFASATFAENDFVSGDLLVIYSADRGSVWFANTGKITASEFGVMVNAAVPLMVDRNDFAGSFATLAASLELRLANSVAGVQIPPSASVSEMIGTYYDANAFPGQYAFKGLREASVSVGRQGRTLVACAQYDYRGLVSGLSDGTDIKAFTFVKGPKGWVVGDISDESYPSLAECDQAYGSGARVY